jgi:aryl-alcohol dehydrogenase-like predicted oxidoreductase
MGAMETRKVGTLQVSVVGLGTNNFGMRMDEKAADAVVKACLNAGINHFDTADGYGGGKSEEFLGRSLGKRRDEAVIATKFGSRNGGSADVTRKSVDESLVRLGTDRIDLMYLHRPDANTPIEETLEALNECVQAGKVREIACSNFSEEMVREADAAVKPGAAKFVAVQNHFNLLNRADLALLPTLDQLGVAHIPFFPLASGMLTGKYHRGEEPPTGTRLAGVPEERRNAMLNDANFDDVERLTTWAADHGHSVTELAIAWLAAQPAVASVIAGATKTEQVDANAAAATWTLSPAQVAEVTALLG